MEKLYNKFCVWIVKTFGSVYYKELVAQNATLISELNTANEKIAELSK